jgi:ubiquinone biosynthesis protein
LRNELDYRREERNAERFRTNFADEPYLHIPHVYGEYTTPRLMVLERIRGIKLDDIAALDAAGYDRHQIAVNSARIILKEVLEDAFFHADPHPGNFVVMPGGVIGDGLWQGGIPE